jgi:predicted pyridoxine 5'-phosphate oxidase superfamily flavin-nucleotide-binding protein
MLDLPFPGCFRAKKDRVAAGESQHDPLRRDKLPITSEVRQAVHDSVLCWLATVDAHAAPSVSPKEFFALDAATLLIADIASAGSVRNIRLHPQVCVSVLDVFRQRGAKLIGLARVVAPTAPDFAKLSAPLEALTRGEFPIRNVIAVTVTRVVPIFAPSYAQYPAETEADKIAAAHLRYGVRPR